MPSTLHKNFLIYFSYLLDYWFFYLNTFLKTIIFLIFVMNFCIQFKNASLLKKQIRQIFATFYKRWFCCFSEHSYEHKNTQTSVLYDTAVCCVGTEAKSSGYGCWRMLLATCCQLLAVAVDAATITIAEAPEQKPQRLATDCRCAYITFASRRRITFLPSICSELPRYWSCCRCC